MRLIGVTGTNGKTSTATFLADALERLVGPVPLITTVGGRFRGEVVEGKVPAADVTRLLDEGVRAGARYAIVETTSRALAAGVAKALPFYCGVFTNLTRDHFDYHPSAEHYFAAKAQLFANLRGPGLAVLNAGSDASTIMADVVPPACRTTWYRLGDGEAPDGTVRATAELSWDGADVQPAGSERFGVATVGLHFAENALAAYATLLGLGFSGVEAAGALDGATAPPGRFEVLHRRPYVVVDYAHTPDAVACTVATARTLATGRVTLVMGAAGGRDRGKRPLMGAAGRGADRVLVTSDNSRGEDAMAIAREVAEGVGANAEIVLDRGDAIETAVREAKVEDVVLVVGLGHERTLDGAPFDERQIVAEALGGPATSLAGLEMR